MSGFRVLRRAPVLAFVLASFTGGVGRAGAAPGFGGTRFEANVGQADPAVLFVARAHGRSLLITGRGAWLLRRGAREGEEEAIRMTLPGARFDALPRGVGELPGRTNYFLGPDPNRWRRAVPAYQKVVFAGAYPGVDLVYRGSREGFEYDFVVGPGADPRSIAVEFDGVRAIAAENDGSLRLETSLGSIRQRRPVAYQERGGVRTFVPVGYAFDGPSRVRFAVGRFDPSVPLTIDPVLSFSSYLGGALDDSALAMAADAAGNLYVAGQTNSLDFPVTPGVVQSGRAGGTDAFVAKIDPSGTTLEFATYLGGSNADVANGIAIGPGGTIYVAGETSSADFPTTPGAFQSALPGGSAGFVVGLGAAGDSLAYATYFGGSIGTRCNAVAVNGAGEAYVTGRTNCTDLPTTPGVVFPAYRGGQFDGYVAKFNATGSGLVYSTFLGGLANDALFGIALGPGDTACVAGGTDSPDYPTTPSAYQLAVQDTDPVITRLDAGGTSLLYSTFLGGGLDMERATAVAVDSAGFIVVTGFTRSADFPTKNAAQATLGGAADAWAARFDPGASGTASLVYSTYLGGDGLDRGNAVAADGAGGAWVAGQTDGGPGFPLLAPIQAAYGGGPADAFVTHLSATGAVLFSSYLGGTNADQANAVAAVGAGAAFAGGTASVDFPTDSPFQATNHGGSDAFFARIEAAGVTAAVPALSPPLLLALAVLVALGGVLLLSKRALM